MASLLQQVTSELRKKPASWYRHTPTAKADRERITMAPVPAMVDPIRTLGHPARPRKQRRRR